jgi:putative flippase GtrA
MDIQDAQREARFVFVGGFWGQIVSSAIWLVSAALGTWVTPRASILAVVIGGSLYFRSRKCCSVYRAAPQP